MKAPGLITSIQVSRNYEILTLNNILLKINTKLWDYTNLKIYSACLVNQENEVFLIIKFNIFFPESLDNYLNFLSKEIKVFFENYPFCLITFNILKKDFLFNQNYLENFENFCDYVLKHEKIFVSNENIVLQKNLYNIFCYVNSIKGKVIWNNYKSINIEKGKYYAKELYSEYSIDSIQTLSGLKVSVDSIVFVEKENVYPIFSNKCLVFYVEEVNEKFNGLGSILKTYRILYD